MKSFIILSAALILSACSTGINPEQYAGTYKSYDDFSLCHGYGCSKVMGIGLQDKEWKDILRTFKPAAKSADDERRQIAKAAAKFERYAHRASGLPQDRAEARHLPEDDGQMDCIDETVNLSQFLTFLSREEILKFHAAGKPIHRGYFIDGKYPHNTATITELVTGNIFAVDGFYSAGGEEPHIIESHIWLANWRPEKPQQ